MTACHRALVVAPHADDEAIGCGGTVRRLTRAGWQVGVCLVTEPEDSAPRLREFTTSLDCLGVTSAVKLGYQEQTFLSDASATAAVFRVLDQWSPALVMAPHPGEKDPDHYHVSRVVCAAVRAVALVNRKTIPVLGYEVWTPLALPELLADIGAVAEEKRIAIQSYSSQLHGHDYTAGALGLNAYRAAMLGPGSGFCEAFATATPSLLGELSWLFTHSA